jgi:exosortase/archaeosortase family protein
MQELEVLIAFLKNRVNLFYVLAFIPLVLIFYFNVFGAIIPTFGFLLLLMKKEELTFNFNTHLVERVLGFSIIFSSFFLYYLLVPSIFTSMAFYGSPNYIAYIFGLCLTFFGVSSLKKAFTPLFLMVAASSNPFVSKWLEQYLSSYVVPFFVDLIVGILRILGISVATGSQGVIILQTWNGPLPLAIIWSCVGVTSMFIFSTILVVLLFEDSSNIKTKLLWSFIGILGTFLVNIIRVTLIFLTDYYLGSEAGGRFHYTAGYILFFAWLALFFFIFSKRNAILRAIQLIRHGYMRKFIRRPEKQQG